MQNIYATFHDWRARLFQDLHHIENATLETLRQDMQRTLKTIDAELERRKHITTPTK